METGGDRTERRKASGRRLVVLGRRLQLTHLRHHGAMAQQCHQELRLLLRDVPRALKRPTGRGWWNEERSEHMTSCTRRSVTMFANVCACCAEFCIRVLHSEVHLRWII